MSVYQRGDSPWWHYDFKYKGKRYTGSTGVETRRKAEAVERKIRQDVSLGLYGSAAAMTLDEAAGRWWSEIGKDLATGKVRKLAAPGTGRRAPGSLPVSDVERRLEILLRLLGPETRLVDLNTDKISRAIEKRRGETYQKAPDRPGRPARRYPVSNATVNADIIMSLRRIMTRAETVWGVAPMPKIDWKALRLREPEPEIRIYSAAQRQAWSDQCDPIAAKALEYLLRYGLRLSELFFPPEAFLPADEIAGARIAINKRKRGVMLLPLREQDGRDIATRVGRARAAKLDTIWFEELVIPPVGSRAEKVILQPVTYYGMQARLRSAAKRAGVDVARVIHGARHHAGSVILAKTENLRLAKDLLGHADIKSTLRYAHAMDGALRAALEALPSAPVSRDSPEPRVRRRRQVTE